jgi:hypothetical protein
VNMSLLAVKIGAHLTPDRGKLTILTKPTKLFRTDPCKLA